MGVIKRWFSKKKEPISREIKRAAVIEKISAPGSIKEGDILKIQVSGYFSNLSWSMDLADTEVSKKEIIVIVIGKKKAGMMGAHALKPYEIVVEVKGLKKGKYKILAKKGTKEVLDLEVK
ncbi:MAG: hypothetical protein HZR80_12855 [Candidatus Heimdallarchaeota archaeon]